MGLIASCFDGIGRPGSAWLIVVAMKGAKKTLSTGDERNDKGGEGKFVLVWEVMAQDGRTIVYF